MTGLSLRSTRTYDLVFAINRVLNLIMTMNIIVNICDLPSLYTFVGFLFHYEEPGLQDLYFLDPQWLCDLLAKVVSIREVNLYINNGKFR